MNANEPIRSIAVVGGGVVARGAALTLARALPGVEVTLLPAPVGAGALADWFPVLFGSARACLARWGLDEAELLRAGCAMPRLATRYEAWGSAAPWLAAEGAGVAVPGPGALHQRWLRAEGQPGRPPFHDLLPAAVMAQASAFGVDPPPPLDRADHGLRLDARLLAEAMAPALARAGVRQARAPFRDTVRTADGAIAAIRLDDGISVPADLFVDATGPDALLQEGAAPFLDWSGALPADRLLIAADAHAPAPLDTYRRFAKGWSARWPGPRRSLRAVAYGSSNCDEAEARREFGQADTPAALVALRPSRRIRLWNGNCLAIGEAAAQFGPLGLAGFSFVQAQLALAIELLPPRSMPPVLLAEYDRLATLRADRLCDWLAAHHLPCADTAASPFWTAFRPSPSLAVTLEQFAQRGTLPYHDEESVDPAAWHAVLIGQGIRPRRDDPIAMAADPATLARDLAHAAAMLADAANRLPLYPPPTAAKGRP